jgi:prophage antirepressor-like protein
MKEKTTKLAVFEGKRIRKILHEGEWWFSIIDVIETLVGGDRPRKYWNDLKKSCYRKAMSSCPKKSDD